MNLDVFVMGNISFKKHSQVETNPRKGWTEGHYQTYNSQFLKVINTGYLTVNIKPFKHSLHIFHNYSHVNPEW